MSKLYYNYVVVTLLLIITFSVFLTILHFRFASSGIDTVSINAVKSAPIDKLDQLFIANLTQFTRGQLLDTLLSNKEHTADIAPMAVSKCQISQKQYNAFTQWAQFNNKLDQVTDPGAPTDEGLQSRFIKHKLLGRLNAPVTGVSYYQARAYCRAAGGRLPKTDEWEAAASGKEGRLYPWGDEFRPRFWRFRNPILNVINHCEAYPESATPDGALDMGNSVSEWTTGAHNSAILKGGNAFNRPYNLHALNLISKPTPKNFSSQFVGFRCTFDQTKTTHIQLPWGDNHHIVTIEPGEYTLGIPSSARIPKILATIPRETITQLSPILRAHTSATATVATKVSRYEITVNEYAWFLRDPLVRFNFYANEFQPAQHSYIPDNWEQQQQYPDAPVTGVSWWDAYAFASWAGGRLPSVDEWNSWYGGSHKYLYPWSDTYVPGLALVRDHDLFRPQAVTTPQDINSFGLVGLAGNVSEWTSSLYLGSNEQSMIIKGGNFLLEGAEAARVDYIARAPLYHRSKAIGFRVVF